MRIGFLTSIYPTHAERIYRENPTLKNQKSDHQMDFIRWNAALSTTVNRMDFLMEKGINICNFNIGLSNVNIKWANENRFIPVTKKSNLEIGIEKIRRFKPDIIYCLAPLIYINNSFISELLSSLNKKPKLVGWYGANCGNENIFSNFDLTLSNSKNLVSSLRSKGYKSKLLQHSFELDILKKIKVSKKIKNRISFFGNLNMDKDFYERSKTIESIKSEIKYFDIFAEAHCPKKKCEYKYEMIKIRHKTSKFLMKLYPKFKKSKWADEEFLPKSPWELSKKFTKSVNNALYGKEMFEKLSQYRMTFNKHNNHTGDVACNMRIFEATGMGKTLVTDNKSDISDYFLADEEVVVYNNKCEAIEKIKYLNENPNVSESIARKGQLKCHNSHNSKIINERLFNILVNL